MENSYDEECFKKMGDRRMRSGDGKKVVQWIGKRKLHGRVRVAFIEESYERQGYRMGDTQAGVCVQGAGKHQERRAVRKK